MLTFYVNAELINANPDPNGEPWYAGGVTPLTEEQQKIVDAIPQLTLPEYYKDRKMKFPYTVDNSLNSYFRPVFCQQGGSCSQASGIGYVYTYEQNYIRGTSAQIPDNQYPTHYTYNFLNSGSGENGSVTVLGWDIVASGGCPNVTTYGGLLWPSENPETMYKLWMTGYNKYDSGMDNRILEKLSISVGTPDGLQMLKQWFNDHLNGSSAGGLAVFSAGILYDFQIDKLTADSYCPGEFVVLKWDKNVNHSMTLVGYNDSIRWDYNKDGKFTNNIDITGDGKVDMQDWEIGAVRMVNSWGDTWADGGKSWVMYRTMAQNYLDGGIYSNIVYMIRTRETFNPALKMKIKINYNERNDIKILAGIAKDITAVKPELTIEFPYFNYQGGDSTGMTGDGNIIELGLDITPLLNYTTTDYQNKIFLCVEQKRGEGGQGYIEAFSIFDEDGTEYVSNQTSVEILNDSITYATVILPQAMKITTTALPAVFPGIEYSHTMTAIKGASPYIWDIVINYSELQNFNLYPTETLQKLTMSNSDDGFANINLPFAFPFFDKLYNSLTITTNGAITFNGVYENVKTLADVYKTKTIAACAADFKINSQGGVYYYVNEDYAVIKWKTYMKITGNGGYTVDADFAAKLFSDGRIEFFYGTFSSWLQRLTCISNGTEQSIYISFISYYNSPSGHKTSFITQPYPFGMEVSGDGIFGGILEPTDKTEWNVLFKVADSRGITALKELQLLLYDPTVILTEPENLFIIKNEPSAILTWDQVTGATIYNIYRSADPYNDFIQIGTSTVPSYEDSTVLSGNMYFYYISADNSKKLDK